MNKIVIEHKQSFSTGEHYLNCKELNITVSGRTELAALIKFANALKRTKRQTLINCLKQ